MNRDDGPAPCSPLRIVTAEGLAPLVGFASAVLAALEPAGDLRQDLVGDEAAGGVADQPLLLRELAVQVQEVQVGGHGGSSGWGWSGMTAIPSNSTTAAGSNRAVTSNSAVAT